MPDAAPLVTVDDLRDYMSGVGLTTSQEDAAQDIIDGLVGQIEAVLGRPVAIEERVEYASSGWLSATPVQAVHEIDGYAHTAPLGRLVTGNLGYAATVRYTGGLGADPSARRLLRITILRAAAAEMTNRHDDTVSVKDLDIREPAGTSGTPFTESAYGVTPEALAPLMRWKRHAVFQRAGSYR